jgi:DNA polymerase III subunit beta
MMETETRLAGELLVKCSRDDLSAGLGIVTRAVSTRGAVQVLAGIELRAEGDTLRLGATDMELSLRTTVPAKVESEGAVVAPGRLLTDLVRLLPADDVELAFAPQDGVLTVRSGAHSSRLNVYAAEDFPRLPSTDVAVHEIESASLLATIDQVSRAASRDESRPVLTGILVSFEGPKLVMAATDSYRLSVKETSLASPGPELEAIIPARALTELSRLSAGETIRLGVSDNHVVFGAGESWLTTRRIDGQFPNYKQLLPETFEVELALPRAELLGVVRRAAVVAQRNTPLRLRFAEGELSIAAQSQDYGETSESLPAPYSGEPLEIGFNADFLREGLESIASETVQLQLINPLRPGLLTDPADAFWYLIMPIRLAG